MLKVSRRGGFSDRNQINPINTEIQLTDFDDRTRMKLDNFIRRIYYDTFWRYAEKSDYVQGFCCYILDEVYVQKVEPNKIYKVSCLLDTISETILQDNVYAVLDVVEAIIQYTDKFLEAKVGTTYMQEFGCKRTFNRLNALFRREYVGYRYIDGIISPISNEIEVDEITAILNSPFSSVHEHISKANQFLSDRDNPDYENSIKESISAVEATCQELLGMTGKRATLKNMLDELEKNGVNIHPAMKSAFDKLYGYTSDANGIRHAGNIGGPSSTFEEARFMLVSCSAFVNYLLGVRGSVR